MSSGVDDVDLLVRWAAGCRRSGAELFERYCAPLHRFFETKAPDAADDLTQATLLACVEGADRLRERRSFRSYMFGIARNLLYGHYREQKQRRGRIRATVTTLPDRGRSLSSTVARRNEDLNLMRALAMLPMDTRILLELTYWEEISVPELADVLGVPPNTIYSRLHRAKHRLRHQLSLLEPQPELAEEPRQAPPPTPLTSR